MALLRQNLAAVEEERGELLRRLEGQQAESSQTVAGLTKKVEEAEKLNSHSLKERKQLEEELAMVKEQVGLDKPRRCAL